MSSARTWSGALSIAAPELRHDQEITFSKTSSHTKAMIFFLTSPVQKSTGREKCVSAFLRVILSQDFVCNAMQTYFSETPNVTPTDQGRSPSSRKISVDFPPQTALHCHRMAGWNGMSL